MGAGRGLLVVETIAKVRRAYFVQKKAIKAICREFRLSRKVVRKVIRGEATEFRYERARQPLPRIGPWRDRLDGLLLANEQRATRERLTLIRVFEELRGLGYEGGLRRGSALRPRVAEGARRGDGRGLCTAELCAGRGLPVRLEPRDRADEPHAGHGQGGACPALSQPDAVCASLSAREPGDGVR